MCRVIYFPGISNRGNIFMKLSTREIAFVATGTALIVVCSWISLPMTIPVTLQTFAVCFVSALLGLKTGMWSVVSYILLGALGVPVFSGFRGGPGVLLGVTGGYIAGFIFTALAVGFSARRFGRSLPAMAASLTVGVILCSASGPAWCLAVYPRNGRAVTLGAALGMCVVPYLVPDAVKIILAAALVRRLQPVVSKELVHS